MLIDGKYASRRPKIPSGNCYGEGGIYRKDAVAVRIWK